jgi:hypothetical protein
MGITVNFSPAKINCGVIPPGGTTTQTAQSEVLSAPANVTAAISADTSGGALTLLSVVSFITQIKIDLPGPGDLPPGTKPIPIKTEVPVQVGSSNGVTPLAVASGQYVVVTIQFAPSASTPDTSKATLLIHGDTWDPVSIPIAATVGTLTVDVPSITVKQGATTTVDVTVTSVAGPSTTADLIISADGSAVAPNVTAKLSPASLSISKGKSATAKLKVSADSTLATGAYSWSLAVWAFDKQYSFSVPVTVHVAEPYYFIQSKLDGNVIDIAGASTKSGAGLDVYPQKATGADNQLWEFILDPAGSGYYFIKSKLNGNVIDIQDASTKSGALLDAYPQKAAAADNQLWEFVLDPAGSGYYFIVSKLNGYVIDIQGASTKSGALLDTYPLKVTGYDNQLWAAAGGDFPAVVKTVPAPPKGGLKSNYNYLLYNDCIPLINASVTIDVTDDIAWESASGATQGFSFQLNCYSPTGFTSQVQQYVIGLIGLEITGGMNNYDGLTPILFSQFNLASLPSVKISAGYKLKIILENDSSGNVTGATYVVIDNLGKTLANNKQAVPGTNLAPIVAIELNLVGPINGESAVLSSGAGTFTYTASSFLTALSKEPTCAVSKDRTAETTNSLYGVLPATAAKLLTQSFTVSGG